MEFNTNKFHVFSRGNSKMIIVKIIVMVKNQPIHQSKVGEAVLDTARKEKDLGISRPRGSH